MLMVAPRGRTKEDTSRRAPSRSVHSILKGSAPTEEAEENAIIMAGAIPLKNWTGEIPASTLTVEE